MTHSFFLSKFPAHWQRTCRIYSPNVLQKLCTLLQRKRWPWTTKLKHISFLFTIHILFYTPIGFALFEYSRWLNSFDSVQIHTPSHLVASGILYRFFLLNGRIPKSQKGKHKADGSLLICLLLSPLPVTIISVIA